MLLNMVYEYGYSLNVCNEDKQYISLLNTLIYKT